MAITDIDICNKALVLIGASKISSFTEGTTESETAQELYDEFAQELLTQYPWNFCKTQLDLGAPVSPSNDLPLTRWERAWNIPTSTLIVRTVYYADKPIDYGIMESYIFTDADEDAELIAEVTYRPSESAWPAFFRTALEFRLASMFAGSVTGKAEFVDAMGAEYEKSLARGRSADSQSVTARKIRLNRFTLNR